MHEQDALAVEEIVEEFKRNLFANESDEIAKAFLADDGMTEAVRSVAEQCVKMCKWVEAKKADAATDIHARS